MDVSKGRAWVVEPGGQRAGHGGVADIERQLEAAEIEVSRRGEVGQARERHVLDDHRHAVFVLVGAQLGERALQRRDDRGLARLPFALPVGVHEVERRAEDRRDLEVAPMQFHRGASLGLVRAADGHTHEGTVHAERQPESRHCARVVQFEQRVRSVGGDLGGRGQLADPQQDGRQRQAAVGPCRDGDVGALEHHANSMADAAPDSARDVDLDAVLAALLGRVERPVGLVDQVVGVDGVRRQRGDADAGRDVRGQPVAGFGQRQRDSGDRSSDALGCGPRAVGGSP